MKSVYTNDETNDKIYEIVRQMLNKNIHLKKLKFRSYLLIKLENRLNNILFYKRVKNKTDKV